MNYTGKSSFGYRFIILALMVGFIVKPAITFAFQLPEEHRVPGGIALVNLGDKKPASVMFQDRPVMLIKKQPDWIAVIGLPLGIKHGKHPLIITDTRGRTTQYPVTVTKKAYKTQRLTINNKRQVNPYNKDIQRIQAERKRINTALQYFNKNSPRNLQLHQPVEGRYSSPFGLKRFFNNQPRKPHSGLDIAAPVGTPIQATESGTVIETGDYFFNGKTVFIHHGQGLVSMYCHMNRIEAKIGQKVTRGEVIGTVGKTGRITGPHLHWSMALNAALVDPQLFLRANSQGVRKKLTSLPWYNARHSGNCHHEVYNF